MRKGDSPIAERQSLADLKDAKLGVQIDTRSPTLTKEVIAPSK